MTSTSQGSPPAPGRRPRDRDTDDASSQPRTSETASTHEMLYEQGMAHYQRREWRQALDYFRRVQAADPNWPGVDGLIDEVSWFLQLEQVDSGAEPADLTAGPLPERGRPGSGRSGRGRAVRWLLPVGLAMLALVALAWQQGWLPGIGSRLEREALTNRGQASLAAGDYDAARAAFAELARLDPNNPIAQQGLDRATRLEQLAQAYAAAKSALDAEDWETARARLQEVLAADPAYLDASELLAYVDQQGQASALFKAGVAAYDEGNWAKAIGHLEQLAEMDAAYQRNAVRELLFILYLRDGQALVSTPNASADAIRQAIGRFGKALALRPRNVQAMAESRLASQFLAARQAMDRENWRQAEEGLQAIRQEQPDWAGGQVTQLYYQLLVRRGDEARGAGDLAAAQAAYGAALALNVLDPSQAQAGVRALAALATPTPSAPQPGQLVEALADTVNVRLGPGTDFPVIGQVAAGQRLDLVGRNDAGDWLVVCCIDGRPGWVATRLVRTEADISALPVGLPPTRVPTPTAPPALAATAIPTVAPTPTQPAAPTATPIPPSNSDDDGGNGGGEEPPPTDTPPPR